LASHTLNLVSTLKIWHTNAYEQFLQHGQINIVGLLVCVFNVLKRTIDYYTERGSYVFCSFVDFYKAFDRANYWKVFNKLLDGNVAYDVVKLLSFWYSNQSVSVRWQSTQPESFGIQNGRPTRQGSILSPFLFTRYIREVLSGIINSNIG